MQRSFALIGLVLLMSGCSAMQEAQHAADVACAQQGQRALLADVRQDSTLFVVTKAHAKYVCVSPSRVARLPAPFDVEVLMDTTLGGAGILTVAPGSVADKAGLEPNDIVLTFAGTPVTRAADLQAAIVAVPRCGKAVIMVRRAYHETFLAASEGSGASL